MAAETNEGTLEDVECGLEMPGAASDNAGGRELLKINRDAVESMLGAILNDVYEEQR